MAKNRKYISRREKERTEFSLAGVTRLPVLGEGGRRRRRRSRGGRTETDSGARNSLRKKAGGFGQSGKLVSLNNSALN